MELAGRVPGGAIETERLQEMCAKESRDGGLHSPPPLAEGLQRRAPGDSLPLGTGCLQGEPHPIAAVGGQSEPEHGNGVNGFALAYSSRSPPKRLGYRLSPYNMGARESQRRAELSSGSCLISMIQISWRGNWLSGAPPQTDITPDSRKWNNKSLESLIVNCSPLPSFNISITGSPRN